jgi:hypothetical protein
MKRASGNFFILFLLLLLFAAPGFFAYVCYVHPQWLGAARTNRGLLVTPPQKLVKLSAKSKWRLIYWHPGDCDDHCLSELDRLARVRLALGRRLYQIDQWLFLGENAIKLKPDTLKLLHEEDITVFYLDQKTRKKLPIFKNQAQIFIANPTDYLILAYADPAKADNVYHDLKHLLSVGKNNG